MTLNNKILTKDNLLKRGWQGDKHCIFCQQMEIVPHLFFHCPYIANLWHCIFASHPQSGLLKFTSLLNFWTSCTMLTVSDFQYWGTFLAATVWVIWLKRNHRIFHNSEGSRAKTKYYAICQLYKYWTGLSSNLKNIWWPIWLEPCSYRPRTSPLAFLLNWWFHLQLLWQLLLLT
jgi:zinc-binding in reverse transcriptase